MTDYLSTDPNAGEPEPVPALSTDPNAGAMRFGGAEASMRSAGPGDEQSLWVKAREAVSQALFGTPERAEAKAAGIGVETTPAELAGGLAMIGAPMATPAAAGAAATGLGAAGRALLPFAPKAVGAVSGAQQGYKVAGVPGAVAGGVMGAIRPVATSTASGAIEGAERGGVQGAVGGALLGAVLGGGADKVAKVAKLLKTAQSVSDVGKVAKAAAPAAKVASKAVGASDDLAELLRQSIRAKGGVPVDAVKAVAQTAAKQATVPITNAGDLAAKIVELRKANGMSGAQIAAALKQWHGIPMKEATQAVKMVFQAEGL